MRHGRQLGQRLPDSRGHIVQAAPRTSEVSLVRLPLQVAGWLEWNTSFYLIAKVGTSAACSPVSLCSSCRNGAELSCVAHHVRQALPRPTLPFPPSLLLPFCRTLHAAGCC